MIDPESKRKSIEKLVKWGLIAGVAAVTYPIAVLALEGLVLWATVGGVILLVSNFAPVIGTWVANKRVQALIAVIEANPIETMQNLFIEKKTELERQAGAISDFETEFRNVTDLVEDLKKTDPEEVVKYAEMRDMMKAGLADLKVEQGYASAELENFKKQIDKARRIYKVASAMNKALEKSQSAQAEVFADIKEQVSFDKVRTDLNRAFANLSTAVERRKTSAIPKATVVETGPAISTSESKRQMIGAK